MRSVLDPYLARFSLLVRGRRRKALLVDKVAEGPDGPSTRPLHAWVELWVAEGRTVVTVTVPDPREAARLARVCERLRNRPYGNDRHPDTVRYNDAAAALTAGPTRPERRLTHPSGSFLTPVQIGSTAMDYAEHLIAVGTASP